MKNFLLATAIFLSLASFGQERISQFNNGIQTAYEQGHEWNNIRYIISFDVSGIVSVHQFKGVDDVRQIFEVHVPGIISTASSIRFFENFAIFSNYMHYFVIDLQSKKLYQHDIPDGSFGRIGESMLFGSNYCIVDFMDYNTSYHFYYILDYIRGFEKFAAEFGTPVCRNGQEFVCHAFDFVNGNAASKFYLIDIKTGNQKLMVKNLPNQPTVHYYDQKYWYINRDTPCSFDPQTTNTVAYKDARLIYKSTTSVHEINGILIAMGSEINNYQVVCYDLKNEKVLSNSKGTAAAGGFMTEKVNLFNNYLVCFDGGNSMFHFDYQKGLVKSYQVGYSVYPLSNRIPKIREGEDYFFNGKGFLRINFSTSDTLFIPIETDSAAPYITDFVNFYWGEDKVHAILTSEYSRITNHFSIDTKTLKADAFNPTEAKLGMNPYSKLLRVNDRIYLWSDGLYLLDINGLTPLPSQGHGWGELFNVGQGKGVYCRQRDTFMESYTLEGDRLVVWHHSGSGVQRLGDIPYNSKIREVCGIGNRIYTVESSPTLITCYNSSGSKLNEHKVSFVQNIYQGESNTYEEYSYLIPVHGMLGFVQDSTYTHMDSSGSVVAMPGIKKIKNYFFSINLRGKKYGFENRADFILYELGANESKVLCQTNGSLQHVWANEKTGIMVFVMGGNAPQILLFDGTSCLSYATELSPRVVAIENNLMLFSYYNSKNGLLLDFNTKVFLPLVAPPLGGYFRNLTVTETDTIVYSYTDEAINSRIITYRLTHKFSHWETLQEINNHYPVISFYVEGRGESRLVYTSLINGIAKDGMIQLNDQILARKPFNNNNSVIPNDNFVADNYLYFFALSKAYGRQLYRMPITYRVSIVDETDHRNAVIFPNPAHSVIYTTGIVCDEEQCSYAIFTLGGNMVMQGTGCGSIEIFDLLPGQYLLQMQKKDLTYTISFIKM